jgi:uncharacterized repeat protein (TIGR01451 family)
MNLQWQHLKGALFALGVFAVATMTAQTAAAQTPEGTVIRNIATVTFTDANNNAYAAVADTVDVTVGFAAGLSVTGVASVTPASPSSSNTLTFTVNNLGNGDDSVSVAETITVGTVITVTGYQINGAGPTHGTLAALNTALSGTLIAAGGSITVDVIYDVPAGQGGNTTDYTLTGTSRRDAGTSDAATATINPTETFGVAVTPDGGQNLQHLPTNAAPAYQFTFVVENTGNGAETFDLAGTSPGSAAITIVSVNGTAGTTSTVAIAAGATANVIVEYTIANVVAGTTDSLYLTATSQASPATTDDGFVDVTVIRPALSIVKQAWDGTRSAQIAGDVFPGDFIEYRVEVTNTGTAPAASVVVTDVLQTADVTYVSNEDPGASWASINEAGGTVTATLSGSLAVGSSAFFWVRVQVNN